MSAKSCYGCGRFEWDKPCRFRALQMGGECWIPGTSEAGETVEWKYAGPKLREAACELCGFTSAEARRIAGLAWAELAPQEMKILLEHGIVRQKGSVGHE